MSTSEKLALAARMHMMLWRKTGRVTDTEWMARNREYAEEIIRFSIDYAKKEGHEDLAELAKKLAVVMLPTHSQIPRERMIVNHDVHEEAANPLRYIKGIR